MGDDEKPLLTRRQVRAILEKHATLLGEISEDGQLLPVAAGGAGGRGSSTSPSKPYGPASREREDGRPGERRVLLLETRLLADVVLVGLPNVGKSSLVAALTGARAQVGGGGGMPAAPPRHPPPGAPKPRLLHCFATA
ncbi:hypothetical protein MNEG_8113 [Monoraphidium neglectum]|uniref:Obg domain-containing protein n=1 Tax=Monoraphidium neglectum TaxID=145388 RepID=A0A0D2N0J8_9CHLO|nr:hypothetical protein MNEG_8113 [Monoraphidium neglectum]KIY99850.1 hypothetical protein MNEG_8113 [Monoraphidium neglectum]|eukprot:XP_013898870.1 hypothetical protein MNEG_8113 [Monoraphidium neglectum]